MSGDDTMLTTPLCDLFGIEVPIILAPMGTCTSAELAAAASNAGGLGGIGTLFRSFAAVKRDIDMMRTLTQRPYAINHIPQTLDAEAFRYTLQARPAVISFTLADPGDLVRQAHDAGARVMVQVTTVDQALQAAERGADVISAQGTGHQEVLQCCILLNSCVHSTWSTLTGTQVARTVRKKFIVQRLLVPKSPPPRT